MNKQGGYDMSNEYICPCCGKNISEDHFVCKFTCKGGKAGKGKSKPRVKEEVNQEPSIEPKEVKL